MAERVVSLAPSATATLRAMGEAGRIVAATDHDAEVDHSVGGWLTPDLEAVDALDPDLAVTTDDLQRPIAEALRDRGVETVHFGPRTIEGILASIRGLGRAIGAEPSGDRVAREVAERLATVQTAVEDRPRPVVYCEEWQDPPMVAGNWVPEAVEIAGGTYPFLAPGERSEPIEAREVEAHAPDHAFLHICGRHADVDPTSIARRGWSIPAVEDGRVAVIHDSLLNQPSPAIVEGIERLAGHLHPDAVRT